MAPDPKDANLYRMVRAVESNMLREAVRILEMAENRNLDADMNTTPPLQEWRGECFRFLKRYRAGDPSYNDLLIQRDAWRQMAEGLAGAWSKGGINSADNLTALMAEGEGPDPEVYRTMAGQVLNLMRPAIDNYETLQKAIDRWERADGSTVPEIKT